MRYFGGKMKIPVNCDNCDVRDKNPYWCGYYDKYCENYEEETDHKKRYDSGRNALRSERSRTEGQIN